MSAYVYNPREALFVSCLQFLSLRHRRRFNRRRISANPDPDWFDQLALRSLGEEVSPDWKPEEIHLDNGRTLVLEST